MSALARVFEYNGGAQIRTVLVDGEPWFVAADVCAVLGIGRPQDSTRHLDDDERGRCLVGTPSGDQQMVTVNEPGLYSLILRSRKPEAKAFKRWITHEVLPAIRRTGSYSTAPAIPQTYADALQLAADQARQIDAQAAQLALAAPKVEYVDGFVNAEEDASLIRVFAGQLGIGEKQLREWMVTRKLIYRRVADQRWSRSQQRVVDVHQWLPYAPHKSWFQVVDQPSAPRLHNGQMSTTLYVTPVGKVEIRRLLMKHPIAEQAA